MTPTRRRGRRSPTTPDGGRGDRPDPSAGEARRTRTRRRPRHPDRAHGRAGTRPAPAPPPARARPARTPHGSQPRPRPGRPAPGARTGGRPPGRRPAGHRPPPPRQPRLLRLGDGHRRLRAAVVLLLFVLSLFAARLVQLQGLDATTYAAEAEQGRLRTVSLPAVRGTITDRNGVALATTVDAVNITADQDIIARYSDPATTARVLAPVLHMDATVLQERLTGDAKFVYVAKKVAPKTWREVRELDHPDEKIEGLPGIFGEKTSRRVYPAGKVAANVVGYVGADNKGLGGLEYAMDDVLAGRDGTATYELSAGGRRIPSGVDTERDAVPGRDVRLDDRPRHPVRRAEGDRQGGGRHQVRERHGHRARPAQRRPARDGHRTHLRRQPPRRGAGRRPRQPAADRALRAGQHRQGPHRVGPPRGGRHHAEDAHRGAQPADPRGQDLQGLRGPPGPAPDLCRHHRQVEQHRHHPGRRAAGQPQADVPLPEEVRHRPAHRPRPAGRGVGLHAQAARLVGDDRLHDDVRPGLLRQHRADGVGDRHGRQRRRAGVAAPRRVDHRPDRAGAPDRRRRPGPGSSAPRPRRPCG